MIRLDDDTFATLLASCSFSRFVLARTRLDHLSHNVLKHLASNLDVNTEKLQRENEQNRGRLGLTSVILISFLADAS